MINNIIVLQHDRLVSHHNYSHCHSQVSKQFPNPYLLPIVRHLLSSGSVT